MKELATLKASAIVAKAAAERMATWADIVRNDLDAGKEEQTLHDILADEVAVCLKMLNIVKGDLTNV